MIAPGFSQMDEESKALSLKDKNLLEAQNGRGNALISQKNYPASAICRLSKLDDVDMAEVFLSQMRRFENKKRPTSSTRSPSGSKKADEARRAIKKRRSSTGLRNKRRKGSNRRASSKTMSSAIYMGYSHSC